jgi:hypothetical protein
MWYPSFSTKTGETTVNFKAMAALSAFVVANVILDSVTN